MVRTAGWRNRVQFAQRHTCALPAIGGARRRMWSSREPIRVFRDDFPAAPDDDVAVAEGVRGGYGARRCGVQTYEPPLAVMQWRRQLIEMRDRDGRS